MEYKLVVTSGSPSTSPDNFNKQINDLLKQGFELYGNLCVKSVKFGKNLDVEVPTFYFCQAMVKKNTEQTCLASEKFIKEQPHSLKQTEGMVSKERD